MAANTPDELTALDGRTGEPGPGQVDPLQPAAGQPAVAPQRAGHLDGDQVATAEPGAGQFQPGPDRALDLREDLRPQAFRGPTLPR